MSQSQLKFKFEALSTSNNYYVGMGAGRTFYAYNSEGIPNTVKFHLPNDP